MFTECQTEENLSIIGKVYNPLPPNTTLMSELPVVAKLTLARDVGFMVELLEELSGGIIGI